MDNFLEDAIKSIEDKIKGSDVDGSIKFKIEDLGSIVISEGIVSESDIETDCTLISDAETFQGMFNGEIEPTSAFMSGKLKIEGSMGTAMKFNSIFSD
tara:strand:+ start:107 stop:400 length:294 start_codon:yes stop_codon:yes gene_type:complete